MMLLILSQSFMRRVLLTALNAGLLRMESQRYTLKLLQPVENLPEFRWWQMAAQLVLLSRKQLLHHLFQQTSIFKRSLMCYSQQVVQAWLDV